MTVSRLNIFEVALMFLGLLMIVGPFCLVIVEWASGSIGLNIFVQSFLIVVTLVTGFRFILIELPKVVALTIDDNAIATKNLWTGKTKYFLLATTNAFKIEGRIGFSFDLILIGQNKSFDPISLDYIDNLDEIITALENRLPNLTEDEYGFVERMRRQQRN